MRKKFLKFSINTMEKNSISEVVGCNSCISKKLVKNKIEYCLVYNVKTRLTGTCDKTLWSSLLEPIKDFSKQILKKQLNS